MGRDSRLTLLFEADGSLLQLDSQLFSRDAAEPASFVTQAERQVGEPDTKVSQAAVQFDRETPNASTPSPLTSEPLNSRDEPGSIPADAGDSEQNTDRLVASTGGSHNSTGAEREAEDDQHARPPQTLSLDKARFSINDCFCPLLAVSRYPYKHLQGEISQKVASRFFDGGKFWNRPWDLYYIHPPPQLSGRPLLLVPARQVWQFFAEMNKALESTLCLPTGSKGFVLPFCDDGTPQPIFLGQSTNKEEKEHLEQQILLEFTDCKENGGDGKDPIPWFASFYTKMEAGVRAAKNQKKGSKANRQAARILNQQEMLRCLRRVQCYFGLRPRCSRVLAASDVEADKQAGNQMSEPATGIALPPVHLDVSAPFEFWQEPILVSVDVESNERCHSQVTEVGISILDTLDLVGISPGQLAENWTSRIRSRHLRTREYAHVINSDFIAGCPHKFEFGESEWVSIEDLARFVESCFQPPFLAHLPVPAKRGSSDRMAVEAAINTESPEHKLRPRNVILVGHNVASDIAYLRDLGSTLLTPGSGTASASASASVSVSVSPFLEALDTAELFRVMKDESEHRSLGRIVSEFGITAWNLHNAGNDARYTMEALVHIAVQSRLSSASQLNNIH